MYVYRYRVLVNELDKLQGVFPYEKLISVCDINVKK